MVFFCDDLCLLPNYYFIFAGTLHLTVNIWTYMNRIDYNFFWYFNEYTAICVTLCLLKDSLRGKFIEA